MEEGDMKQKLASYEDAFAVPHSGCRGLCECGREFFDGSVNSGWDWEKGELGKLRADPNATDLDYSVQGVWVQGKEYVRDCDCWHETALKIIGFLDANADQISRYFTDEKLRIEKQAAALPDLSHLIEGYERFLIHPYRYTTSLIEKRLEAGEITRDEYVAMMNARNTFEPMQTAPQNAMWIRVLMLDGSELRAHWAEDLSGEEQPPFKGWFTKQEGCDGFSAISEPIGWLPINERQV